MSKVDDQWHARELGDTTRKLLATANIAGIGIFLALAALLATDGISPRWAFLAIGLLALGVLCVVGGYLRSPNNWWNAAGLVCLLLGAGAGIYKLDKALPLKALVPPGEEQTAAPAADTLPPANNQPARYAAIIDAGSSGSRLWIFRWSQHANGDPVVEQQWHLEDKEVASKGDCPVTDIIKPGKATCACLTELLTQGYQKVAAAAGSAPTDMPLWVKATGGLRKESMAHQVEILTQTDACLKSAKNYSWRGAEAIAGSNEALYAWLAINYARNTLQATTLGIVEIGGQSAQVAFQVPKPIAPTQRGTVLTVPLRSGNLYVYAHSDVLGKDAAIVALGKDAANSARVRDCGLTGDYKKCLGEIDQFICEGPYKNAPCPRRSPEFPSDQTQFIGLSNFMHVTRNVGLDKDPLSSVRDRAEKMCAPVPDRDKLQQDWITATGKFRKDVCLDALYTSQVAQYAWGLPLTAITPAERTDPEWPLGAMFMEIAQHSKKPSL